MAIKQDGWEEQEEEWVHFDIPPEFQHIDAEEVSMAVEQLWSWYMSGNIHLEPEFQREYVWDQTRASKFIESLLLGLPVPAIFLAESHDGTWDVVDGHQRLETLFRFLQPLSSGPTSTAKVAPRFAPLVLKGLEVKSELNARTVTALEIEKRRNLLERKVPVVRIPRSAHEELKFELFARLNLGSMALNPQELRNCLHRGPYNDFIKRIAEGPDVLEFLGLKNPHKRMRHRELVLRFFALAHRRGKYVPPPAFVFEF